MSNHTNVNWPLDFVDPAAAGFDPQRLTRCDQLMQRFVDEQRCSGGVALVARGNRIAHLNRFGYLDLESKQPMRDDAIFRIYSMTKPITSTAVLMLLEEGRFLLDWPVSHFIPQFADLKVRETDEAGNEQLVDLKRPVSIHDLLTHTAGLTYDHVHPCIDDGQTLDTFIDRLCDTPLLGQPGEVWRYSEATDVLGRLVEVVADQPFDQFLADRIFKPLGMTDTGFFVPEDKRDRFASVYTDSDGQLVPATDLHAQTFHIKPSLPSGGGGLVSTTADYLRFASALLNGGQFDGTRLLGPKTVALMADNALPQGHPPLEINQRMFGLGVAVTTRPGEAHAICSPGEFGWGGAAGTNVWIDPAKQMITLIMVQHRPVARFNLSELARHTVYAALLD